MPVPILTRSNPSVSADTVLTYMVLLNRALPVTLNAVPVLRNEPRPPTFRVVASPTPPATRNAPDVEPVDVCVLAMYNELLIVPPEKLLIVDDVTICAPLI